MIIACPACPAQYSVPDAKLRGRKVRVTCKHCGGAIIVDATESRASASLAEPSFDELPLSAPPADVSDTDPTRVMPQRDDQWVHDEPTVVGEVPRELLEAERKFSQATVPPPAAPTATAEVPEHPLDRTGAATPVAIRASRPSLPPQPNVEVKTLLSRTEPRLEGALFGRWSWWLLIAIVALLLGVWLLKRL